MGNINKHLIRFLLVTLYAVTFATLGAFLYDWYLSVDKAPPLSLSFSEEVAANASERLYEGKSIYDDLSTSGGYYFYSPMLPYLTSLIRPFFASPVKALNHLCAFFTFLILVPIFLITRKLSGSTLAALLAPAIFITFYEGYNKWLFQCLPDNLAFPLVLWAFYFQYRFIDRKNILLSAIAPFLIMTAAIAKANFGLFGIAWFIIEAVHNGFMRAAISAFPSLMIFAAFAWKFNTGLEHWFEHILILGKRKYEPLHKFIWFTFRFKEPFFIFALAGIYGLIIHPGKKLRNAALLILTVSLLLGTVTFIRIGGSMNSYYPLFAFLAIFSSYSFVKFYKERSRFSNAEKVLGLLLVLTTMSFGLRQYLREVGIKKQMIVESKANNEDFLKTIKNLAKEGNVVYIPHHPILMRQVGTKDLVTAMMINEKRTLSGLPFPDSFISNFSAQKYDVIIMWQTAYEYLSDYRKLVEKYYSFREPLILESKDKSLTKQYRVYKRKPSLGADTQSSATSVAK